jgi:hypothetical protein
MSILLSRVAGLPFQRGIIAQRVEPMDGGNLGLPQFVAEIRDTGDRLNTQAQQNLQEARCSFARCGVFHWIRLSGCAGWTPQNAPDILPVNTCKGCVDRYPSLTSLARVWILLPDCKRAACRPHQSGNDPGPAAVGNFVGNGIGEKAVGMACSNDLQWLFDPPPPIHKGSDGPRALFLAWNPRVARGSGHQCCGCRPGYRPGIGHFLAQSRLCSPFGLRVGADGGQAKSTTYARRFIVNHGGRSHIGLDHVCHLY